MPSSDVRSSETNTQNARGKNFQKFTCSNFHGFVFRDSYFHILVMGRENLDLAKISHYTVRAAQMHEYLISLHSVYESRP